MNMLRKEKTFTINDIYALPDGERAELIDGEIYYMSPPSRTHQRLLHFLDREIGNFIHSNGGKCEIYPAPFAVFLTEDNINYVEPDISVICDTEKLDEKGCHGAPDWVVEIVSKSSKKMDYYVKLFKYQSAGVREYWIVDSEKHTVTVYNFEKETMEQYDFDDAVPAGIYEEFRITLGVF